MADTDTGCARDSISISFSTSSSSNADMAVDRLSSSKRERCLGGVKRGVTVDGWGMMWGAVRDSLSGTEYSGGGGVANMFIGAATPPPAMVVAPTQCCIVDAVDEADDGVVCVCRDSSVDAITNEVAHRE